MTRPDYRSPEAKHYRKLYNTAAWKRRRLAQLQAEPFCLFCAAQDRVSEATVADHVVPHRGDLDLFWYGELQSLCAPCHDAAKARIESFGYDSAADLDGYPIDPNHPANRRPA